MMKTIDLFIHHPSISHFFPTDKLFPYTFILKNIRRYILRSGKIYKD